MYGMEEISLPIKRISASKKAELRLIKEERYAQGEVLSLSGV